MAAQLPHPSVSFRDQHLQLLPTSFVADALAGRLADLRGLDLSHNALTAAALAAIPDWRAAFPRLEHLDLSANTLAQLPTPLPESLRVLTAKANALTAAHTLPIFPQPQQTGCPLLEVVSLSGNKLAPAAPAEWWHLPLLRELYLGGNGLTALDPSVAALAGTLEVLYLGGNEFDAVPPVVARLVNLRSLAMNANRLRELPIELVHLVELQSLLVHCNELRLLPVEVLGLRRLRHLSLRGNPLLTTFAEEYVPAVLQLKELAARAVKRARISVAPDTVPVEVATYLNAAHTCTSCSGTFFGRGHLPAVEFVDLCGAFQVPFMRYICSERCNTTAAAANRQRPQEQEQEAVPLDQATRLARVRKVLLDRYAPSLSSTVEDLRDELVRAMTDFDVVD